MLDPVTRNPILLIGTTSGQVLQYSPGSHIDHAVDTTQEVGLVISLSATGLTVATLGRGFDVVGAGMKGVSILISQGSLLETRIVETNTLTSLTWIEPLPATFILGAPPPITLVVLGGYDSYWSSGWLAPQSFGSFEHIAHLDFEFRPVSVSGEAPTLTIQTKTASGVVTTEREFDSVNNVESATVDLSKGWVEQPLRTEGGAKRGRYFRMAFSIFGPLVPFSVSSWQFRGKETGQRGGRTAV